jgi:hypothetical protein
MAVNFWLECVIDAYIASRARGEDWHEPCAKAEQDARNQPLRVLTQKDLKPQKGIPYSRVHIGRLVGDDLFPPPFNFSTEKSI